MLFNSYQFIFIFFPLCITGFYALKTWGNANLTKAWLIGFSLWFYGYSSPAYLLIMLLSILLNRLLSDLMWFKLDMIPAFSFQKASRRKMIRRIPSPKILLITGVILNLVILGYYKYFDFLILNLNFVLKDDLPLRGILLPLGISFFTFQQIGYLADIYRKEAPPSSFLNYVLFVCFFPQLVAGPIVSHEEMMPQFERIGDTGFDAERFARNLTLFILGLSKKVILADTLGAAVDTGYSMTGSLGGLDSFLVMLWYPLQLYFDFSGYSDMAIGLAGMLMIDLPVNFDSPYKSYNILDFWKRWHITLTRFLTKYVYIPLGGSRRGTVRLAINILVVYFLSGLWHGAGWNYIVWGVLHGIAYAGVRLAHMNSRHEKFLPHDAGAIINFLYVSFCFIFFRAPNIKDALLLIRNMLTGTWRSVSLALSEAVIPGELWYVLKALRIERLGYIQARNIGMIIVFVLVLILVFFAPNAKQVSDRMRPRPLNAVALGLLGMWCVITFSQVSTFLYYNF